MEFLDGGKLIKGEFLSFLENYWGVFKGEGELNIVYMVKIMPNKFLLAFCYWPLAIGFPQSRSRIRLKAANSQRLIVFRHVPYYHSQRRHKGYCFLLFL